MKRLAVLLVAVFVTACSSPYSQSGSVPVAPAAARQHRHSTFVSDHAHRHHHAGKPQLDNFFRGFPKADSATFGYGHGVKYELQPLPLTWTHDMNHFHWQFLEDYDGGKNDGFDDQIIGFSPSCPYPDPQNHPSCWLFKGGKTYLKMPFSYTIKSDIQPYWTMAVGVFARRPQLCVDQRPKFWPAPDAYCGARRPRFRGSEHDALGMRRT